MPRSIPNYLTIDPATGAVGADFTGHIHAKGIDLDAVAISPDNQVRWTDVSGVVRGIVRATDQTMSFQHANAAGNNTEALWFNGAAGQVDLFVGAAPNTKLVTLLDSANKSSFPMNAGIGASGSPFSGFIYYGYVSAAGAYLNGNFPLSWFRFGAGQYATSFGQSGNTMLGLALPVGPSQQTGRVSAITTTSINVAMYSTSGGVVSLGDSDFTYLLVRDVPQ